LSSQGSPCTTWACKRGARNRRQPAAAGGKPGVDGTKVCDKKVRNFSHTAGGDGPPRPLRRQRQRPAITAAEKVNTPNFLSVLIEEGVARITCWRLFNSMRLGVRARVRRKGNFWDRARLKQLGRLFSFRNIYPGKRKEDSLNTTSTSMSLPVSSSVSYALSAP
jgi:hypothetical protein